MANLPQRLAVVLLLVLSGAAGAAPASSQTAPADWSRLYLEDLEAARNLIAANHPGPVDERNPGFARTLAAAYEEARAAAAQVQGYSAYRIALTRFASRFQDRHLRIVPTRPFETLREPGIDLVYQQGVFTVEAVDARYGPDGAPLAGAALVDCDGRPADELFRERVLSWDGLLSVEASRYQLAPRLLVDYGPPLPAGPSACRFRLPGGDRTVTLPLQWKTVPGGQLENHLRRHSLLGKRLFGIQRINGGKALWVDVPTFNVSGAEEISSLRGLIVTLREELTRNRG